MRSVSHPNAVVEKLTNAPGGEVVVEWPALVEARVVTNETFDSATGTTHEASARPLTAGDGYVEARVDPLMLPARLTAKVKFRRDGPEYRFDFSFADFTREPTASR